MTASRALGLPAGVRRVLVVGASRSGIAAATALLRQGVHVVLSDSGRRQDLPGVEQVEAKGGLVLLGPQLEDQLDQIDLVVKSPGVPREAALVKGAAERTIPVWSEIELAFRLLANPFSAITGTNGKTTVTALLGHIFAVAGRPVRVLGNIGTAATSVVGMLTGGEELVVEVSSFQLEDVHLFQPAAAAFLNLTQDHLDRHGSMPAYLEAKARLFTRQTQEDAAVLNADDPFVSELGRSLEKKPGGPQVLYFSTAGDPRSTSRLDQGRLVLTGGTEVAEEKLLLRGRHNMENCLAAGTTALARGVEAKAVVEALLTFPGVQHRLAIAGEISGVTYVNDSKATNVEAALKALEAYPKGVHLILGGRDKGSDYLPLVEACRKACRAVYLIGEAAPLIRASFEQALRAEGSPAYSGGGGHGQNTGLEARALHDCGDLEHAVAAARKKAQPGDVVLLSPACASFDQYLNYEERGRHFVDLVQALAGDGA